MRIIIADDEEIIRSGLSSFFRRVEMGYEVVGCYSDGDEVIAALERETVDVVSVDINMPRVSGLEVAAYIAQRHLPTKVVIVSGYQDFAYAQKAIEYGVSSYLLKPLKHGELMEVFTRLRVEIEQVQAQDENRRRMDEMLPMLRQQFFDGLAQRVFLRKEELDGALAALELSPQAGDIPFALVELRVHMVDEKPFPYGHERLYMAVLNFLRTHPSLHFYRHSADEQQFILVAFDIDAQALKALEDALAAHVQQAAQALRSDVGAGIRVARMEAFSNCYDLYLTLCRDRRHVLDLEEGQEENARYAVRAAADFIDRNYARPINLSDVAEAVHLSPAYLGRIFKQMMGKGAIDHLNERRIAAARDLLVRTDEKVQVISRKVGFENPKYFMRLFKKHTGFIPTAYRLRKGGPPA